MVAGGQHNVFHAGLCRKGGNGISIELFGGEGVGKFFILAKRDALGSLRPFSGAQLGVKPPVEKHSESHLFKFTDTGKGLGKSHGITSLQQFCVLSVCYFYVP